MSASAKRSLRIRLLGLLDALERMIEPSITEILRLIEGTTIMNQPLTAEQFAQPRNTRTRQVREMSAEKLNALKRKLEQTWAALSRDEQNTLVEQHRLMLPAIDDAEN
jgi:MerR family transcriptional regulator, thiopeptide resistance regulator